MKKKAPALPPATLMTILLFTVPVFIMIGYLVWQIQTIRQTETNIVLTEKKIVNKEQEIASLQSQLATLRTIQANYRTYLQTMEKEFNEAESNRQRMKKHAPYPLQNTTYPGVLTDIPQDIKRKLESTGAENIKIQVAAETNRPDFALGTVEAYGTLEQLYNLEIELLRLTYIDSVSSSMIQEVANKKFITLKFWIRTL